VNAGLSKALRPTCFDGGAMPGEPEQAQDGEAVDDAAFVHRLERDLG